MKNKLWIFIWVCLICVDGSAQIVTTIVTSEAIGDGVHVDSSGLVYITSGGLVNKTSLGIYDPHKQKLDILYDLFQGTIDITSRNGSDLFLTNYDDSTVKKFNKRTKKVEILADGLDGPAGIEMDDKGNIYVVSYGSPPTYNGNTLWMISPDGEKSILYKGEKLLRPQGLAWFDSNTLIISVTASSQLLLFNIINKSFTQFSSTPLQGHIALGRGNIYVTANNEHSVYELSRLGEVLRVFGTGTPGSLDADVTKAQFISPQGIAFNEEQDLLYISEINTGKLRCIQFD